jgi:hypothetical protein
LFSFKEANSISKEELNARANIDPQQIGMLSREYAWWGSYSGMMLKLGSSQFFLLQCQNILG